jgi:hypothetical protein
VPRFVLDLDRDQTLRCGLLAPRLERFVGVIYRPETELRTIMRRPRCRGNSMPSSGSIKPRH